MFTTGKKSHLIETILVIITILLFPLGQLGRISFFGEQVSIYAYEVFLSLTVLCIVIKYRLPFLRVINKKLALFWLFIVYLTLTFILRTSSYTSFENLVSFLYLIRIIGYGFWFGALLFLIKKQLINVSWVKTSFFVTIGLIIISSVVQYFFYPDLRNLIYAGWDPHLSRIFGTFFDTSVSASIVGLLLLSVINKRKILIGLSFVLGIILLLTYTRAAYVAVTASLIYMLLRKKKYLWTGLLFLGIGLALFLIPKPFGEGVDLSRTTSIASRVEDYKLGISIWRKNPVFGIGYNRLRYVKEHMNPSDRKNLSVSHAGASLHSSFLVMLATGGVIGLMFLIILLLKLSAISHNVKTYILFISVLSLFDNMLLHPFVLFSLIILIGYEYAGKNK